MSETITGNNGIMPNDDQNLSFWRQILPDDLIDILMDLLNYNKYHILTAEQRTQRLMQHAEKIRLIQREFDTDDITACNQILLDRTLNAVLNNERFPEFKERLVFLLEKRRKRLAAEAQALQ